MLLKRHLVERVEQNLEYSPIVMLLGPRQVGKTTLVRELAQKRGMSYVSFDDIRILASVKQDPIGFLEHQSKPVVFDEIQRMPDLFLPLKQAVDQARKPGMFILTGSANPLLVPQVADSLAGRMNILHLWPLSQGEINQSQETFLERMFVLEWNATTYKSFSRDQLIQCLIKGGYPAMQAFISDMQIDDWCSSYLTTLLQRDVQDLARIEGLATLPNLLKLLATRPTGILNSAELSRSSGLTTSTLNRYLTLLEALFLVHKKQAWSGNLGKRLIKAPRMYFVDTGIVSYLLNLNSEALKNNSQLLGQLLENFVVSELAKHMTWHTERIQPYHFRTQSGAEVDVVLENKQGSIVGIEVKSSHTITADAFKGLKELENTVGKKFLRGIVLYMGNEVLPFGKNLLALPVNSLWE